MRIFFIIGFFSMFLLAGGAAEQKLPREAARLNVSSLPAVSRSASVLGNLVAPGFADSVVLMTVILGMNPLTAHWDFTRPFSVVFYESPDTEPAIAIQALRRPNSVEPEEPLRIGPLRFQMEYQGSRLTARTSNLSSFSFWKVPERNPSDPVLEILANPSLLRKQFEFLALASGRDRKLPYAADHFIQSFQSLKLNIFMPSDESIRLVLSGTLPHGSPLIRYFSHPFRFSDVELFEAAEELFLLKIPADDAFRKKLLFLLPSYDEESSREQEFRNALAAALTGEIACSVRQSHSVSSGDIPEIKAVLHLRKEKILSLKQKLDAFEETPFDGFRMIAREKNAYAMENILLAGLKHDRIIFLFCPMEQAALERLMKPKSFVPSVHLPFSIYDLKSGKQIAGMEFKNNLMTLRIQADREFFQQFPSIVKQPIHKLNLKKKN